MILILTLDVQLSVASTQLKILSVVPLIVTPPPSAFESSGEVISFNVILLSSTVTVATSTEVVLPEITTLPSMFKFLIELFAILISYT